MDGARLFQGKKNSFKFMPIDLLLGKISSVSV